MDMEEGDLIDDQSSLEGGYHRRNSVSPLPQIRASSENQMSRSSTESDLEDRVDCMPSLSPERNNCCTSDESKRTQEASQGRDICVGCLAAALITNQRNLLNDDVLDEKECDACDIAPHGSKSLPTTLKKYKGNHSTGSCRGINPSKCCPTYPSEVIHGDSEQRNCEENRRNLGQNVADNVCGTHSTRLPFKFYKPDRGQLRKVRTPLKNFLPQSISAPSDNEDSIRACVHQHSDQFIKSMASEQKDTEELVYGNGKPYPANTKRRCSLSRDESCCSSERQNTVTCADLKRAIDYSNDEDISDETEPNSDNDLIVRRSVRETDKGNRKK